LISAITCSSFCLSATLPSGNHACFSDSLSVSHHFTGFLLSPSLSLISSLPFLAGWLLCGQLHKYHWSWFRNHHSSSFLLWLFFFLFLFMSRHIFLSLSRKSEPSTYKEKPSSSRLWVFFSYTLFLGFQDNYWSRQFLSIIYFGYIVLHPPECYNFALISVFASYPIVGYW